MGLVLREALWLWLRKHKIGADADVLDRIGQNVQLKLGLTEQFMGGLAVARLLDTIAQLQGAPKIDMKRMQSERATAAAPVNRMQNWYRSVPARAHTVIRAAE
jgi:hypothetical protein